MLCAPRVARKLFFGIILGMKEFSFTADQGVLDLGIKIVTARIFGVKNSDQNADFEDLKKKELEEIGSILSGKKYNDDLILDGFRDLHTKIGRSNREYIASPESLRRQFIERGRFPHINMLVDIYNLVSLRTGLALGAHDIDKVDGNVTLKLTTGDEKFIPLGKTEPVRIFPGEYGYVDDGDNVICRMEVLQVEPTKVTLSSGDIFLIVEGNANTNLEYVRKVAETVCAMITMYCGGSYSLLDGSVVQ